MKADVVILLKLISSTERDGIPRDKLMKTSILKNITVLVRNDNTFDTI